MRLYHKAKKLGIWDPQSIDFTQDILDWQHLKDTEKEILAAINRALSSWRRVCHARFTATCHGHCPRGSIRRRDVSHDIPVGGGEAYRILPALSERGCASTERPALLSHRKLPIIILRDASTDNVHALLTDQSPTAQVKASITYNLIIEGVLAETGYHAYYNMLDRNNIMPGLKYGIGLLKRDESRHLAYGVFLISRLVAEDHSLWPIVEQYMERFTHACARRGE